MSSPKVKVENIYPLTPIQEGMLFHALLEPRSTAYFEQLAWRVRGDFDVDAFEACWNVLIERHAVLRTLFAHEGTDRPLQVVLASRAIAVERRDLRGTDARGGVEAYKAGDRARPFVLSREPLVRVAVLRVGDDEFDVVWSHHHIVLDGWSVGLVLAELLDLYRGRRAGTPPALPAAPPFSRFVKWLQGRDDEAAARFWSTRVGDCPERITVAHTRGDGAPGEPARGAISFGLGTDATAALHALAARCDVTMAVVLQAVWAVLLGRYADVDDVVFGSVVSGRPPEVADVDRIVGNFINTIPVRARLGGDITFADLLARVQHEAAEAGPYQHAALTRVQSAHRLEDGLFGTLVSFANYPVDGLLAGDADPAALGFVVEAVAHTEQTHYDLDVQFVPAADLQVRVTWNARFYERSQIEAIPGHMRAVVDAVTRSEEVRLDAIDPITEAERIAILGAANRQLAAAPEDTLCAAFARQAALTPDRVAVVAAGDRLTYRELKQRTDGLAHRLRDRVTLGRDARVAVLVGRGTDLAVGLLGVLSAGAAYVPLDSSLPRERIAYIIEHAGCRAVVASAATAAAALAATSVPVIDVDDRRGEPDHDVGVDADVRPSDLAYVIYTSGSTGRPKGVMIEHHSVVNLVHGLRAHVYDRYAGPLRVGLLAACGFDASVQQIFPALLLGHTLVVVDEATKRDGAALNRFLVEHAVEVIDATPTLVEIMVGAHGFEAVRRCVRHALVGGEPLPVALSDQVVRPGGMVVSNVYGPTECCVDATAQLVTGSAAPGRLAVPIGRPLPGVRAFVIGRTGHLAPLGARGEICIAGAGVGRGYVDDEALTAARFVRLAALGSLPVFRTADAGQVLADGALDCLGRLDDQVKVRGFRIELGEIEHRLCTHPGVSHAAAFVARTGHGDELRATLVLARAVEVDALRAHLGESMPEHMIPSRFFRIDELPRTGSGKLDRKALAAGQAGAALEGGTDYAAPGTERERLLVDIWQAALGVPRVGIDDNYFSLGGDSIKAIQILSRLMRHGLRLEIRDLFRHRTIRSLVPFVTEAGSPAPRTSGPRAPALTAAQARFFAEHRVEPGRFHHAVLFDASARLDPRIVARAFAAVRDRHEGLRLTFHPEPRATPPGGPVPDVRLVTDLAAALPEMLAPMELAAGPLQRIAVVQSDPGDRVLIVVHHLCVDGVSWRILAEELGIALTAIAAGEAPDLPAITDGALDVARGLADYGRSDAARSRLAYWKDVEDRAAPLVDAPGTPPARYRDRDTTSFELDAPASAAVLVDANHAYGTTPEDLLLAALARAIHARFGATTTGLLLESHGRYPVGTGPDPGATIGWFTSLYPFALSLEPGRDLGFQIKSVKEAVRAVPDHGISYGLLRYLDGAPLRSRPQVSFNYLGQVEAGGGAGPLRMSPEVVDGGVSPDAESLAELEASAIAVGGRLRVMLAFNALRFEGPAMRVLLESWRHELLSIVEHCRGRTHAELTPADLSYSGLSVDELEDIFR